MSFCVECRWCRLHENSQDRLSYVCERRWRQLEWAVARKNACEDFEPQPAAPHWGP